MGAPTSVLSGALGFASDFSPDQVPKGFLLDIVDFVPDREEARLTSRGAWVYGTTALTGNAETGILATFSTGDMLFAQTDDGRVSSSGLNAIAPVSGFGDRGAAPRAKQNPIQLGDTVIHFDRDGARVPQLWRATGAPIDATATMAKATVGTIYKNMLVTGGDPTKPSKIQFSKPGEALETATAVDANSEYDTSQRVTALAALRSVVLIFHPSSVERMRGSTPAHTGGTAPEGDMFLEKLFDRAGCIEPRSIAYWNDNVVFADEHGVHLTDGAVVRNLVTQGSIANTWRPLYQDRASIAATTFMDYYVVTIRSNTAQPSTTLVCNLNTRRWFRFKNIEARTLFSSAGSSGMERVWAGIVNNLASIGPCFLPPVDDIGLVDGNLVYVQPHFVTPWFRLGDEGRKRIRFLYLSYDLRKPNPAIADPRPPIPREGDPEPGPTDVRPPVPDPPPGPLPRPPVPPAPTWNGSNVLQIGYLVNSPTYPNANLLTPATVNAGWLPSAAGYARYKLPVGKAGYGISIFGDTTMPIGLFRLYDIAVEYGPSERSRQ